MQSVVEVVCVGNGSNKTYNSVYTDPGYCKMVIVQDDDKFPSPRLCLLRRWPNFEGGFGFNLYEDLFSSTGALKVEEVVRHSPAEAGGLRKNDVIIEINGDNIELKSFFQLVEILKDACSKYEMELLVLAEQDAQWYRVRNITVNSNFPNIEYCETPYYGHILKPLDSLPANANSPRMGTSQIEFHSSTGKLYRTTLVIDKERDSVYRRIEELPSSASAAQTTAEQTIPPLRPDGTFRHPGTDNGSVRVYYRRDRKYLNNAELGVTSGTGKSEEFVVDSGHGSLSNRRSTPLSTGGANLNTTTMSPFSTLGKSHGESMAVDLLHDKWADEMDKYLDSKFRSGSAHSKENRASDVYDQKPDKDTSVTRKSHVIRLNDPTATVSSKRSRSRCQSPNDASFSYIYSGRDDLSNYQSASATSFRDLNRQTSPYQNLPYRGSPQTQSHNRYPSPHQSVQSPSRVGQRYPSQSTSSRPQSQQPQTQPQPQQLQQQQQHQQHLQQQQPIINHQDTTITTSTSYQYDSSTYTSSSVNPPIVQRHYHQATNKYQTNSGGSRENSPSSVLINQTNKAGVSSSSTSGVRGTHNLILRPKAISNQLGFQLDETEVKQKGVYFVKYVESNSPSAMAGLKEGDKITKINGKTTLGMPYDQFCEEIIIAQQQQLKNNMIHLMVMRKSTKSTGTSSYSATSTSNISNVSGPTVLPIKNNLYKDKSSSFVDEGYGPDSATSSTTTAAISQTASNTSNLVSIVRVTSPSYQTEVQTTSVSKIAQPRPAQTTEIPPYVAYESTTYVKPNANIIYDSQELKESEAEIRPVISESTPFISNVLLQKQEREREQREREQREREQREREQRERELREREQWEREQREREQREREQWEREQREREQREREQREKEFREREQRERELWEREQRERELERERKERELREKREKEIRELQQKELERIELERKAREREEIERQEREKREFDIREKELREKEERDRIIREQQREKDRQEFEKLVREKKEREEKEKQQFTLNQTSPSNVQSSLAALTTIVTSAKPEKAETRLPQSVLDETTTVTSTVTKEIHEITTREEIIQEYVPQQNTENIRDLIETDYSQTHVPDDDDDTRHDEDETASQISEEERKRLQFAGNYSNSIVFNVAKEMTIGQNNNNNNINKNKSENNLQQNNVLIQSTIKSNLTPTPIPEELKHLVDTSASSQSDVTLIDQDVYYVQKIYIFKKEISKDQEHKQPTLAQIIQTLNTKGTLDTELIGSKLKGQIDDSSESSTLSSSSAPYSLGIRLKQKTNSLEVGNHIISYIEPNSLADKAGIKLNSRLIQLNEITCEEKTHDFVVYFLNYILRKNSVEKIELTVEEPVYVPSRHIDFINESFRIENENLKSIIKDILVNKSFESSKLEDDSTSILNSSITSSTYTTQNSSVFLPNPRLTNLRQIISEVKEFDDRLSKQNKVTTDTSIKSTSSSNILSSGVTSTQNIIPQTISSISIPAINTSYTTSTTTTTTYPSLPSQTATTQLSASASTGIENLKSIILQITNKKHYYDHDHVPVKLPQSHHEEYTYETQIKIPSSSITSSKTDLKKDVEFTQSDGVSNLKQIFLQATTTNRDAILTNDYYLKMREKEFKRQQEVMSDLVVGMENPKLKQQLRTYNLYNSQHFFGYGIAFHTEHIPATLPEHKLVYPLIEIESNSPSEEAGMRNGQRVVAVNGRYVNKEIKTLEDVVQDIEESYYNRNYTEITVLEPELWVKCMDEPRYAAELANFRNDPVNTSITILQKPVENKIVETVIESRPAVVETDQTVPRLIRLVRQTREEQYGFEFKTIKHEGRHVANNVQPGLPADKAGLRNDDIILEVNGEVIHGMEHDAVVKRISANPNQADLFVVADSKTYFAMVNKQASPVMAVKLPPQEYPPDEVNIELRVPPNEITYHRVNLIPGFKGLGISLTPSGIISAIEANSPSEKAGLKKDHRIVEVNGVNVREKSNKEIAEFIKKNENDLVIGVIDTKLQPLDATTSPSTSIKLAPKDQPQISELARPYDENITLVTKTENLATQSVSSATGTKITGSMSKISGSHSNLTYLKSKFGSCLGLGDKENEKINKSKIDSLKEARVCNIFSRPDYNGFGFSMKGNERGPHQISSVEPNSPAEQSGLKESDYILKVNDLNVVGERYSKTVALIKNESEKGRLKLEVVDPKLCPIEIKTTPLTAASGYSTVSTSYGRTNQKTKSDSIQNLREITNEMIATDSPSGDRSRAVSVDTGSNRRPYSMSDIDRIPANSTVRSNNSFGSAATGLSQPNLTNMSSRSVGNLSTPTSDKPKFKRCVVQLIPEFNGFGFTLNSKVKPKYMIHSVDPASPSYAANLRQTDVIVEIDRKNIRRLKFDKVRQLLSESQKKGQVEILAISKEGYMYYKNKKKRFSSTKLVTPENTEPYSTYGGIQTRDSSVNNRIVSSDNEGDNDRRPVSVGATFTRPSTSNDRPDQLASTSTNRIDQIQSSPSPSLSNKRIAPLAPNQQQEQKQPTVTGTDLDSNDIILCTVKRRPDNQSLGLSLSTNPNQQNRSLSRASGTSSAKENQTSLPVITSVEPDSPAEQSGLRPGDVVIEINGKSTYGQPNKVIIDLIRSAGQTVEFTITREKTEEDIEKTLRENAMRITETVMEGALARLPESTPIVPQRRLSRRDSASLNSNKSPSQQNSPQITHTEIKMSSSRLQQQDIEYNSQQSPSLKTRNQSAPAPDQQNQSELVQSSTSIVQSSPISRRSSSSFTLPRDAPIPRLCRVRAYEDQLGFTVAGSRASRGVFKVNEVAPNSPAAHSGLQNDDYIIEISGVNVENMEYSEVINYIKQKKQDDDLQLLVADQATLKWYKTKKIPISSQIVPKMQYIETLLKEELERELNNSELNTSDQYAAHQ